MIKIFSNHNLRWTLPILLISFLSCSSLGAQEQIDTTSLDWEDSSISTEDSEEEEEKEVYFLQKSMAGAQMDSLRIRQLPDSFLQSLKRDEEFWYAGKKFRSTESPTGSNSRKQEAGSKPLSQRNWFEPLLWFIIIVGFAFFVITYLANSNIRLFSPSKRRFTDEEAEEATDDIFAIPYQREIEKAVSAGNYRFAVRLMFLQLLKSLSERKIIQYKPDRTNFDYLVQLGTTRYYPDFFRITRNYEYSWYGKFEINRATYDQIKKEFDEFEPMIKLHN